MAATHKEKIIIEQIGNRVADRRKQINLTQEALAKSLGISIHALSAMERGKADVKVSRLVRMAELMNCSVNDLLPIQAGKSQAAGDEGGYTKMGGFLATVEDIVKAVTGQPQEGQA